jgi:hypothetical protein
MDKTLERRWLDAIFGSRTLQVVEHEEPDFHCIAPNGFRFGVEVTEFFESESHARLTRVVGYGTRLLSGGEVIHKDDRTGIPVSEVVYYRQGVGDGIPIKAIAHEIPAHRDSIPRLLNHIASKNAKCLRYCESIQPVDLIVHDVNKVLRYASFAQLTKYILDADELRNSPFREIYLITASSEAGAVAVPLRATIFGSEIATFASAYRKFRDQIDGKIPAGEMLVCMAAALSKRLANLRYQIIDGKPRFIFGSIAFDAVPSFRMADISIDAIADAEPLEPAISGTEQPAELERILKSIGPADYSTYEISFPVETG